MHAYVHLDNALCMIKQELVIVKLCGHCQHAALDLYTGSVRILVVSLYCAALAVVSRHVHMYV